MNSNTTAFNALHDGIDWNDTATWFCFDCLTQDTENYYKLDGYIRCTECTDQWHEKHTSLDAWR